LQHYLASDKGCEDLLLQVFNKIKAYKKEGTLLHLACQNRVPLDV